MERGRSPFASAGVRKPSLCTETISLRIPRARNPNVTTTIESAGRNPRWATLAANFHDHPGSTVRP